MQHRLAHLVQLGAPKPFAFSLADRSKQRLQFLNRVGAQRGIQGNFALTILDMLIMQRVVDLLKAQAGTAGDAHEIDMSIRHMLM